MNNPEYDNSILIADKPLDISSAGVLNKLKWALKIKKAGHAGTLDPKATGMLIICTGKKTKEINRFMDWDKEYVGVIRIGAVTKCYDTEGEEEQHKDTLHVTDEMIEEARKSFLGNILQLPPMHSAIKRKGVPLYELARQGEEVERKPRDIRINRFDVKRLSETEVFFTVECSKGTYIRSLANDFGAKLGVGGYLKSLRRTKIGEIDLSELDEEINGIKFKRETMI